MPVIDDIKENTSKLKGKSFKYKLEYFIQYYGVTALVIIACGIFIFSIIKTVVTAKDTAFEAIMINASNAPSEEDFANRLEIDLENYEVFFDYSYYMDTDPNSYSETSYTNAQKIMAVIASGSADVILGDPLVLKDYFHGGIFADLRDYLSKETYDKFKDKMIWYQPLNEDTGEPEGYEIPVAIEIADAPRLIENNCFIACDSVYFGIVTNTKNPDWAEEFLKYIYEQVDFYGQIKAVAF